MGCARLAALALATATAGMAAACAASKGGVARTMTRDSAGATREGVATGLELLRWFVPNDAARRREGLERVVAEGLATRVASELDANGFTLLRVDVDRLGETLGALGESASARSTLLGQPTAWTDLVSAQVPAETVVFVAGRPRAADQSILSLAIRGWCFPTVDSARARVEIRLSEDAARVSVVSIDPSAARVRSTDLPSGRAVLELAPDEALILLETPVSAPEANDGDGPATALPPTVAALLLDGRPIPNRSTVLVVIPALADILPPTVPAAESATATGPSEPVATDPAPAPDRDPAPAPEPAPE